MRSYLKGMENTASSKGFLGELGTPRRFPKDGMLLEDTDSAKASFHK
jgi:hypothetical protein